MTNLPIDSLIKPHEARQYLKETYDMSIARQTLTNWMLVGIQGRKLAYIRRANVYCTTMEWIDEFLESTSR